LRASRSAVIDRKTAHDAGSNREEVCPVLPLHLALIDQFEIGLVDQR
jgi:hypothetical protein